MTGIAYGSSLARSLSLFPQIQNIPEEFLDFLVA